MTPIYFDRRKDQSVDAIIKAAFPDYNGQHVQAHVQPTVYFHGTMWDEGSRRTYVMLNLATLKHQTIPQEPFMQDSPAHRQAWTIPNGCVIVVHVQGRYEHIEIITPTNNITPALEQTQELTPDEEVVLQATAGLKSSYGGISNFRFHEANRITGITVNRYEAAKTTLINKKLLNKAGAITVAGRNVIGSKRLN